jgi:hypothetical protein
MILIRPERNVLESLARLQGTSDFDTIMAWIASSHESARDQMESAVQDAALRQLQGAAIALGEIRVHAKEARTALERLRGGAHY